MPRFIDLLTVLKFAFGTTIALSIVTVFFALGPTLETRYWPVLDKLQIKEIRSVGPMESEIYVAFNKRRDCDYKGIAWYRDDGPAGLVRVVIQVLRAPGDIAPPNRPLGYQQSGPWRIALPAAQIRGRSVVETIHVCHWFWVTRTKFYP